MHDSRFRALWQMDRVLDTVSSEVEKFADYEALLNVTDSLAEATAIVSNALLQKLAGTLSMPLENINADQPIQAFGADSLVAIEVRNWLSRAFGSELSVFEVLGQSSNADPGRKIADKRPMA